MFGNCGPRCTLRWWWSDVYLRRFVVWYINTRRILCTTPVYIIDDISSLNVIIVHGFESSGPCVPEESEFCWYLPVVSNIWNQNKHNVKKDKLRTMPQEYDCVLRRHIVYLRWSVFYVLYRCYCIALAFKLTFCRHYTSSVLPTDLTR